MLALSCAAVNGTWSRQIILKTIGVPLRPVKLACYS